MARTNNLTNFLTDVSSAIKQKTGDSTPIPASDFDTEILSIETAGNYQSKTLNITQNGNYNLLPDQEFDAISNVNISVSVSPVLQNKTVTENGSYSADSGYDGLGTVIVNVSGGQINNQDKTVIENGVYTADSGYTGLGEVTVNVSQEFTLFDSVEDMNEDTECSVGDKALVFSSSTNYLYGVYKLLAYNRIWMPSTSSITYSGGSWMRRRTFTHTEADLKINVDTTNTIMQQILNNLLTTISVKTLTVDGTSITADNANYITLLYSNGDFYACVPLWSVTDNKNNVTYDNVTVQPYMEVSSTSASATYGKKLIMRGYTYFSTYNFSYDNARLLMYKLDLLNGTYEQPTTIPLTITQFPAGSASSYTYGAITDDILDEYTPLNWRTTWTTSSCPSNCTFAETHLGSTSATLTITQTPEYIRDWIQLNINDNFAIFSSVTKMEEETYLSDGTYILIYEPNSKTFNGMYYKQNNEHIILPITNLTLNNANQLLPGISGYGSAGVVTGNDTFYDNNLGIKIWNNVLDLDYNTLQDIFLPYRKTYNHSYVGRMLKECTHNDKYWCITEGELINSYAYTNTGSYSQFNNKQNRTLDYITYIGFTNASNTEHTSGDWLYITGLTATDYIYHIVENTSDFQYGISGYYNNKLYVIGTPFQSSNTFRICYINDNDELVVENSFNAKTDSTSVQVYPILFVNKYCYYLESDSSYTIKRLDIITGDVITVYNGAGNQYFTTAYIHQDHHEILSVLAGSKKLIRIILSSTGDTFTIKEYTSDASYLNAIYSIFTYNGVTYTGNSNFLFKLDDTNLTMNVINSGAFNAIYQYDTNENYVTYHDSKWLTSDILAGKKPTFTNAGTFLFFGNKMISLAYNTTTRDVYTDIYYGKYYREVTSGEIPDITIFYSGDTTRYMSDNNTPIGYKYKLLGLPTEPSL